MITQKDFDNKQAQEEFERWYKVFLWKEEITERELIFLRLFTRESKEGKAYVEFQKESLEKAYLAGWVARQINAV
jgi:hypothetical protein